LANRLLWNGIGLDDRNYDQLIVRSGTHHFDRLIINDILNIDDQGCRVAVISTPSRNDRRLTGFETRKLFGSF
jgi:hypothetical protein